MEKALVLYRSVPSAMDRMASVTPEQRKGEMEKRMVRGASAGTALVEWGALGVSAVLRGSKGPGFVSGNSMVQAESLDWVRRPLDAHPHVGAPGAAIDRLAITSAPGRSGRARRFG